MPKKKAGDAGAADYRAESEAERNARARDVFDRLKREYPDAECALHHRNPYELLVATILSAQCTDVRVNKVTPDLFEAYPEPEDLAGAREEDVQELIRSTGFFRNKTRSLLGMAQAVIEEHGGEIPDTMDELTGLPGVGRKTANVILGTAFEKNIGVVVDTHVKRLSRRLGLTIEKSATKIEAELMERFDRDRWTLLAHLFIFHGRQVCKARTPLCAECVLSDICPSSRV